MSRGLECRSLFLTRAGVDGRPRELLRDLSARFEPGALALIDGAVGVGKTSLLHVLSTVLRPSAGEVLADGEAVSRYTSSHRDLWRRQAGIVFQAAHFLDGLSALENVMAPLVPKSASLAQARGSALTELERFQLTGLAARRPAGLSGGERQRVSLARALVGQPRFVFADEPTAHQDAEGFDLVLARLSELKAAGAVVVVVSHDPRLLASGLADARWHLTGAGLARDLAP